MPSACPWTDRVWREFHADNLTRAYRDVLLTLRTFRGIGGACWPSHETLADRAGCCVRTVQRALKQALDLGLVSWSERRVKAGWRWLRTSNWYRFAVPGGAVQMGQRRPRSAPATTGQLESEGKSLRKKGALQAKQTALSILPPALLSSAKAVQASQERFLAAWLARRGRSRL